MPSAHKNPAKAFRPPPDLYDRAKQVVADVGSDMNSHLIGFLRWLTHETDELPSRSQAPENPAIPSEVRPARAPADCPECGTLLDPDGSCFVCRN